MEINKRIYTGHAIDQMQNRGIMSSVIENTIKNPSYSIKMRETERFYDSINNITVVTNSKGKVITVFYGK